VYGYTVSLTSALDGGGWTISHPGCFVLRKETQYPLCRRLGGPQGQSGLVWKISPPLRFDPQTVHPIASPYINYTIPAHVCFSSWPNYLLLTNGSALCTKWLLNITWFACTLYNEGKNQTSINSNTQKVLILSVE